MTRLVLILAVFISFSNLNGQGLRISVHADPQFGWITSDESHVDPKGTVFNINTGLELDFYFMRNYAFTLGADLNNLGGKLSYTDSIAFEQTNGTLDIPAGSTLKHNLQYAGVPVGLKLKSEEIGYTSIFIHGGLYPMFNLKASTSSDDPELVKEDIKPEIPIFSMNYFISAGVEYNLAGSTALLIGVRWSAGFTDVTSNDLANNNLNSLGLNLGILF